MTQFEKINLKNQQYTFNQEPKLILLPETRIFTKEELQNCLQENRKNELEMVVYTPECKKSQSSFSNQANEFLANALGAREITFPERAFESSLSSEKFRILKSKNSQAIMQMRMQKLKNPKKAVYGYVPTESYFESYLSDWFDIKGSPISSKLNIALILPQDVDPSLENLDNYLRSGLISSKYPRLAGMLLSKILTPRGRLNTDQEEIYQMRYRSGYEFRYNETDEITINKLDGGNEGEINSGNAIAAVDIVGTGKTAETNNLTITDYYIELPGMLFLEARKDEKNKGSPPQAAGYSLLKQNCLF